MATRIIETAKGNYRLLSNGKQTIAVSTIDNDDVFEFNKPIEKLRDKEVIKRIESTIEVEEFDADFLNDDFSWVHDFEQYGDDFGF